MSERPIRMKRKSAIETLVIPKSGEVELPKLVYHQTLNATAHKANNFMKISGDPYELGQTRPRGAPGIFREHPAKQSKEMNMHQGGKQAEERKIAYEEAPEENETQTYHRKASGVFRSSKAASGKYLRRSVDSSSVKNAYGMDAPEDVMSGLSTITKEQRPQQPLRARKV